MYRPTLWHEAALVAGDLLSGHGVAVTVVSWAMQGAATFQDVTWLSIKMTNTVRCRYNAVKFLRNPHKRHSICPPIRVRCGVSFVSTNSDLYSIRATPFMLTIYAILVLHIICVESGYTCAQMNQGWRPIYVDIQISLTFRHLCSMPDLIYECYTASQLHRAKLYVIRIIFINFHICATLPFPELHLTEMVCFQCIICLHVFHILFRLFVIMFDSRRFLNRDRHPAFFVILYHHRRWTGSKAIFW